MKKLISWIVVLAFVLTMVGPGPFTSTVQAQGLLNTGDYVYFGQYNGQPLLWRVITIDDDGDPLLFSEAIVTYKAFDGAENDAFSKFANRQTYGSNRWFDSNIREWLNSKSVFVTYSTTPPSAEAMLEGYNAYDQEPGFLYHFSSKDQEAIKPILHKELLSDADESFFDGGSAPHNFVNTSAKDGVDNYDSAYYEEVQDSVFLLSIKDLADYVQGRGWSYKKSGTAEALAKDESGLAKDSFGSYWLSTPASNKEEFVRYVYDGSYVYYTLAYDGSFGICPALYLDLDLVQLKTGAGTLASPYFVQGINEPIAISDANLEAAIRQTIDQPSGDILLSDVLNITKLDASGRRIESLDGLEKLANLEVIDISYNKIIDLSPLRNLKKIKRVYGQYNEIESLSTLFYDDVEVVSPIEEINITGNNLPATKATTDKIKELEVKGIEVIHEEINEVNGGVEEIVSTSEGKTKEQLASEVDAVVKQAGFIELPAVNNTVTLTGELLYEPAESAMKVSKQAEKILIQKNLSLNRTIKSTVEVHPTGIDGTKPFTLMLDPTILDVNGADEIEVITEAFSISFAPEKLQKDFQSTQLLQFIVQVTGEMQEVTTLDDRTATTNMGQFAQQLRRLSETAVRTQLSDDIEEEVLYNGLLRTQSKNIDYYGLSFEKDGNPIDYLESSVNLILKTGQDATLDCFFSKEDTGEVNSLGGQMDTVHQQMSLTTSNAGQYFLLKNNQYYRDITNLTEEEKSAVQLLTAKGYLTARGERAFAPNEAISRAELATAIIKMTFLYDEGADSDFTDVKRSDLYYHYIASSKEKGIVSGYPDNTFKPDNPININELVKIDAAILAYFGYIYPNDMSEYITYNNATDIKNWVIEYLNMLLREEAFLEMQDNSYNGDAEITRKEAALLLYKLYKKL